MQMMTLRSCAVVLVAAVLATSLPAAAANGACDPTYDCSFETTMNGTLYQWDFSELCSDNDYVLTDDAGHSYYTNICGYAAQNCLPATWTNRYEYGVAIQMWGGDPPHTSMQCQHVNGKAAYCTKDCQVLGVGAPSWQLNDFNNPFTGGILATFAGAQPSTDDPFFCPYNPETGQQEERKVTFRMLCDYDLNIKPLNAIQNSTDNCHYGVEFSSMYACANNLPSPQSTPLPSSGISAGWVLIIIGIVVVVLYVVVGMGYKYATAKEIGHPHTVFWIQEFPALLRDGFLFLASGFKKRPDAYARQPSAGAAGVGSDAPGDAGTDESYQGSEKMPEAYTDL